MSAFTKEFVVELAEKAGLEPKLWNHTDAFERFFDLAVAAERERILEICKEGLWDGAGLREHAERVQE